MTVIDIDDDAELGHDLVGPVIRAGDLAEAVIDAVEADNPGSDVYVLDRDDGVMFPTQHSADSSEPAMFAARPAEVLRQRLDLDHSRNFHTVCQRRKRLTEAPRFV